MQRCIDLAIKGMGKVAPNPLVGCVIVHSDRIIGEGYHQQYGQAHAEVNAIRSVEDKELLKESTLYVSLEPCVHYGKTPPCADLIIDKKIPRVIIGSDDPYPKVSGKGIVRLKNAGVEVTTGVLKDSCDFVNRRFLRFYTLERPYVILKWAQSTDGIMAPADGKQLWLTNDASKKLVHQWRSEEQAILVGRKTVEIDNPLLTVRLVEGKNPVRVVIGRNFAGLSEGNLFRGESPAWIFNPSIEWQRKNISFIKIDFTKEVVSGVLDYLWNKDIQSVIIEGGPATLQYFVEEGLWDEARIFTTPHVLSEGKKAPVLKGKIIEEERIGGDRLEILINDTYSAAGNVK